MTGSSPTARYGCARFPERRWAQGAWLACGFWVVHVHASGDELRAQRDGELTVSTALQWAAGAPLIVGGDFNLREPAFNGLRHAGERDVDHLFVGDGVQIAGPAEVLDRGGLSDHPPLAVTVERPVDGCHARASAARAARSPKPRSISSAFSPSVPRAGSTPSCVAAS